MKKHKKILIASIIFVILLASIVLGVFSFGYSKYEKIQKYSIVEEEVINEELDVETIEHLSGYMTFAIFGVDARDNDTLGKGTLADVNMICRINNDTGEIRLMSIYRDTFLDVNGKESFNKLNSAYSAGGPEQALKALNKNLDLNITDFVTVNWKAVADAINILGGIDVEITKNEFRDINGYITETVESTGVPSQHLKSAGMNHLDGVQAVSYSRLRLRDTDFQRTERQRLVIQLAMEKAKSAGIGTLLQLVDTIFPQVMTSLDDGEMITIAKSISRYHIGASDGFPFTKKNKIMGAKGDCVIPLSLSSNVTELHKFLFDKDDYVPSATVKKLDQLIKSHMSRVDANEAAAASRARETYEETLEDESETLEGMENIPETDENGETIPRETDENGETIPRETDANGELSTDDLESESGTGSSTSESTQPTGPSESGGSSAAPSDSPETGESTTAAPSSEAPTPTESSVAETPAPTAATEPVPQ